MTKDEALKLALEKFEFMNHVDSIFEGEFDFQINAIKEALAQPEQDWIERERAVGYREGHQNALKQMAQPEQDWSMLEAMQGSLREHMARIKELEAQLAEPEQDLWGGATIDERWYITRQPEQEPVCIGWDDKTDTPIMGYTSPQPPQRKPLTDEQIEEIWERTGDYDSFARAIEAAHQIYEDKK